MNSQLVSFGLIISIFLLYTSYKVAQLLLTNWYTSLAVTFFLFFIMLGGVLIYKSYPSIFDSSWFQILVWLGSIIMGLWTTFIFISLPFDLIHLLLSVINKFSTGEVFNPIKISSFFRNFYIGLLAVSIIMVGIGFYEVWKGPKIKEINIFIKDLSPSFNGLKIAQISDLHIGPTLRMEYVKQVVSRTNALNPDFIFITGDLNDAYTKSIEKHLDPLKNLQSKFGIFYVTGNHEYYWDVEKLIDKLKNLGFQILLNENKIININSAKFLIAGITDPEGKRYSQGHIPDIKKASQTKELADFKVLLSHRPNFYDAAEQQGFDLQFSGHTHAGQFFPFSLLIGFAHKYSLGLHKHGKMWIYVNRGTGYWGPANRLGVSPEITLVTLLRE